MCGRYSLDLSLEQLLSFFKNLHLNVGEIAPLPRQNIAPSDIRPHALPVIRRAPIIYRQEQQNDLEEWTWRLIPRWNHGQFAHYNTINAKSETLLDSKMYHGPWLDGQRCLVPATGVIEWQTASHGPKRPQLLKPAGEACFAMGGIWEHSLTRSGHTVHSFAILTTEPNESFAQVHDRMPVVIAPEDYTLWLEGSVDEAMSLCQTYTKAFQSQLIGRAINNPEASGSDLLRPLSEAEWQTQNIRQASSNSSQQSLF